MSFSNPEDVGRSPWLRLRPVSEFNRYGPAAMKADSNSIQHISPHEKARAHCARLNSKLRLSNLHYSRPRRRLYDFVIGDSESNPSRRSQDLVTKVGRDQDAAFESSVKI